jgi:C-terminal processing protease CtpA/Prc
VKSLFIMVTCLAALLGSSLAEEPRQEAVRLIAQLADPAFTTRQQAARALRELGEKHLMEVETALAHAYQASEDPEVRYMSREILTTLFINNIGFLGIRFGMSEYTNPAGITQWTINVLGIQPDTAATKSDLLQGDLILSVNGKKFTSAADTEWRQIVKSINSGSSVVLKISRDQKEKQISAILGRWPFPLTLAEKNEVFAMKLAQFAPAPPLDLPPGKSP